MISVKEKNNEMKEIAEISEPQFRTDLPRFVRMINYSEKFIPNLSMVNKPLRKLQENDSAFMLVRETSRDARAVKTC